MSESDQGTNRFMSHPIWVTVGPFVIASLSLILAVYGLFDANRAPKVQLSLPDRVRMAQGPNAGWLYVQPRFVSTTRNDRIEVITDLRLLVAPAADDGAALTMRWEAQGTWDYDPVAEELTFIFLADPGPLVVSPASPQQPLGLFEGPPGWRWEAGTYQITVLAERAVGGDPLRATFAVIFSEEEVRAVNAEPGQRFLTFPTRPAVATPSP